MTASNSETLETERLVLRRPRHGDVREIFESYAADPEVTRYLSWPTHRTIDDTWAFLAFSDDEWRQFECGPYVVFSRADGRMLGSTGLSVEAEGRASVGYVLAQSAWGHGYAREALTAVFAVAPHLGVQRLEAFCHVEHQASARVLEKSGFVHEGVLRRHTVFPNLNVPGACDVHLYTRVW